MTRWQWLPIVPLLLAGCSVPAEIQDIVPERLRPDVFVERAASHWAYDVEPAMAPDFTGDGPTYPILLIHTHHVASARQREEMKNVVCLAMDGAPIEVGRRASSESMDAACMGPVADAATGRVFVDRAEFDSERTRALAIRMSGCGGGVVQLTDDVRSFQVVTSAHTFVVAFARNGTFLVDDRWIEPGTTLKIGYFVAYGSEQDEEYVRVAFESPGAWLRSRIGEGGEDIDEHVPPRPAQGSGLVLDVPLSPGSLGVPVKMAVEASPRVVDGIQALRVVHDGTRITELTLVLSAAGGPITWYGAGRTGDALRLFAADGAHRSDAAPVPVDAFLASLDLRWDDLAAGSEGATLDVRLAPDTAWSTAGPLTLAAPRDVLPCPDGCVWVEQGGDWMQALAAQAQPAEGALTLRVLRFLDGSSEDGWWHAPAEGQPVGDGSATTLTFS